MKNGENFEMLYKLAEKMNAAGKLSDCFTCKSLFVLFQCGIAVYCLIRIQVTCMLSTILFFNFFFFLQWVPQEQLLMLDMYLMTCKLDRQAKWLPL